MNFDLYNNYDENEIQRLFTEVFSESEGEIEGQIIGGLVYDLMNNTEGQDLIGCIATEKINNLIVSL